MLIALESDDTKLLFKATTIAENFALLVVVASCDFCELVSCEHLPLLAVLASCLLGNTDCLPLSVANGVCQLRRWNTQTQKKRPPPHSEQRFQLPLNMDFVSN